MKPVSFAALVGGRDEAVKSPENKGVTAESQRQCQAAFTLFRSGVSK
jgi:hypothetical protein